MRFPRLQIALPFFAVLLLSVAGRAAAEPVTFLASGSILYSRADVAEFHALSMDGIEVSSQFGNDFNESWNPDHACIGCTPGQRIDLSQSESFTNGTQDGIFAGGSVRVDNVDYFFDSMSFGINAHHIDIPDTTGRNAFINAGQFVFNGMITGTSDAGVTRMFHVHGKGTVSVDFGNNDWFSTNYKFADASAAAVPEPGTMLLFGSGAVAALVRRRRQQRR